MSKIDDMIAELCPDGVEYKRMEECGSFLRGSGIQKKDFRSEGKPCIHYGQIYTRFDLATDHALSLIEDEQFAKSKKAMPGAVIIAITSENIDDVCTPLVWEGDEPVAISGHSCAYQTVLEPRYIAYYLTSEAFQRTKKKIARGTKVIEVKPADLARVEIPVPPMEVQREIVRVLDSFAKLEAELEAELEARKRQYAYYRDQLLSFERERVPWLGLGLLGAFERGRRFTKADYRPSGIPSIHYAEVYTKYNLATSATVSFLREDMANSLRYANQGDLVIACTGETKEDIAKAIVWEGTDKAAIHDDCSILHVGDKVLPRYLAYCFQTGRFSQMKKSLATESKNVRISADRLAGIEIPVPSLETQQRIVEILDRFDVLTTSLTDGLPAEIAARRQQYEHYRDKLLTFPRKDS